MVFIKDIMHRHVFTIDKSQTVFSAAEKMSNKGISCLVIVEEDVPKGIITRRDIFEKVIIAKKNPEEMTVAMVMTTPVVTMNEGASLIAASGIMNARKIKQVPIVSEEKLVGIVTQTDIVSNINTILGFDRS
ncbi:MAG: CBS domain-containing protein [Nanobdellota archaeon]